MRYFVTFACYGAHLHGDDSGSVDQHHNLFESRLVKPDPQRAPAEREKMPQLCGDTANIAGGICWQHICGLTMCLVVQAGVQSERVMVGFKSYASRALNRDVTESQSAPMALVVADGY